MIFFLYWQRILILKSGIWHVSPHTHLNQKNKNKTIHNHHDVSHWQLSIVLISRHASQHWQRIYDWITCHFIVPSSHLSPQIEREGEGKSNSVHLPWQRPRGARADIIYVNSSCPCKKQCVSPPIIITRDKYYSLLVFFFL